MNNNFTHTPTSVSLLDDIRTALPSHLDGKRLDHTYFVEKEALKIARLLFETCGIDEKYLSDVSAAALLHDITKQLPSEKQYEIYKNEFPGKTVPSFPVIHSHTGAVRAKQLFGINDIVYGAIYSHTTGKENMNLIEKIIFIADYIEESRTHPSCIAAREYFYGNINNNRIFVLNKTILTAIDATVNFLIQKESTIDIETISARNSILLELSSDF